MKNTFPRLRLEAHNLGKLKVPKMSRSFQSSYPNLDLNLKADFCWSRPKPSIKFRILTKYLSTFRHLGKFLSENFCPKILTESLLANVSA